MKVRLRLCLVRCAPQLRHTRDQFGRLGVTPGRRKLIDAFFVDSESLAGMRLLGLPGETLLQLNRPAEFS